MEYGACNKEAGSGQRLYRTLKMQLNTDIEPTLRFPGMEST